MRGAPATAGMLSAAVLLSSGCEGEPPRSPDAQEPVRRAAFRSLAARDFLAGCPAGAELPAAAYQLGRYEELRQLALRKEAGQAIWLGENDWAAVSRYQDREPCEPGDDAYAQALAAYSGALDILAARIAEYRP